MSMHQHSSAGRHDEFAQLVQDRTHYLVQVLSHHWQVLELIRAAAREGVDLNLPGEDGDTLLHTSIRYGHETIACTLIEQGANVNARGKAGSRPLHLAGELSSPEMVHFLLLRGADMDAANKAGFTPTQLAIIKLAKLEKSGNASQIEACRAVVDVFADAALKNLDPKPLPEALGHTAGRRWKRRERKGEYSIG